jgi:two-component system alkaline phosphatase synthesis response regulator PhoP
MGKKILVIEDEQTTRSSIARFLQSEGFEVFEADNGRSGIEVAQTVLPDLVICDILMPELDGYDVLNTLQANPQTARIPFIFLTATAKELGQQHRLAMGADDYLSKPVTTEHLRRAIAAQLNQASVHAVQPFVPSITDGGDRLEPLLTAKSQLLAYLCQRAQVHLVALDQALQLLKSTSSVLEQDSNIETVQIEIARLRALFNEVTVLQNMLMAEDAAAILRQFQVSTEQ